MDFNKKDNPRGIIDDRLKALNKGKLSAKKAGEVNWPLLSPRPGHPGTDSAGYFPTNARASETYDHIGIFVDPAEKSLPRVSANSSVGKKGPDAYDYGVFRFTDLIREALKLKDAGQRTKKQEQDFYKRCNADVSDHLPVWVRLPIPGA